MKKSTLDPPPNESPRMFGQVVMRGTSKENTEFGLTQEFNSVMFTITKFDTAKSERTTMAQVPITNLVALKRFRALLDIVIKTQV